MKKNNRHALKPDVFNAPAMWLGFVAANIACLGLMAMLFV